MHETRLLNYLRDLIGEYGNIVEGENEKVDDQKLRSRLSPEELEAMAQLAVFAGERRARRFLEERIHKTSSKWEGKEFGRAPVKLRKLWEQLGTGVELGTFLADGSRADEIFREIDPRDKNLNTGICLSSNKESPEDCRKRPSLEDVYNLLAFGNIAKSSQGQGIIWIPDSAYKENFFHWENVREPAVIEEVSARSEAFCSAVLPQNCKTVRMSSVDFSGLEERTGVVLEGIKKFYSLKEPQLNENPHLKRALHRYALTMAVLALDLTAEPYRDILNVANSNEKGTVEVARKVLQIEGKPNKMALVSPVHVYGFDAEKSSSLRDEGLVDSMFDSSKEGVLYVGASADENRRKIAYLQEQKPELVESWVYLLKRLKPDIRTADDLVACLDEIRRKVYGTRSEPILTSRRN